MPEQRIAKRIQSAWRRLYDIGNRLESVVLSFVAHHIVSSAIVRHEIMRRVAVKEKKARAPVDLGPKPSKPVELQVLGMHNEQQDKGSTYDVA